MNEVSTTLRCVPGKRRRGLNSCLLALGAAKRDLCDYKYPKFVVGGGQDTLYYRYSKEELLDWATTLYKKAMIKYHPDRHLYCKYFYELQCREFGAAFQQAKRILTN